MAFTHPENVVIDQSSPFTGNLLDVKLGGTSKAYIDQDGNVVINGTPGTVGLRLNTQDITGVRFIQNLARIVNYGSGDPLLFEGYNAAWFAWHRFGFNMYAPPGFYGIEVHTLGAGIPTALRLVDEQGQAVNQGPKIMLAAQRTTGGETDISAISGLITDIDNTNYKGALAFYTANAGAPAEKMRIDHIGNVGIGTASPGAKLEVVGGPGVDNGLRVSMGAIANLRLSRNDAPGRTFILRTDADQKFKIIDETAPGTPTRLAIDTSGNVGIGTVNPSEKLEVVGNIKASGNMNVSGLTDTGQLKVGGGFQQTPPSPLDLGLTIDGDGTINTNGNLQVLRTDQGGQPVVWHLGRQGFRTTNGSVIPEHVNYFFWHDRMNRYGWWWSGWNTFRHPATLKGGPNTSVTVARGYGYYPFRNMAKNYLLEASGEIVTDFRVYGPVIYFQNPLHIDLNPESPPPPEQEPPLQANAQYTSDIRPYKELGPQTTLTVGVSAGSTQITVADATGFEADDEIFIGTANNSEINEIANKVGNTLNLKRDTKQHNSGVPVKKVRELGGVQPDRSATGLAVYIRRNGDDLVFKDNRGAEITLQQIRAGLGLP